MFSFLLLFSRGNGLFLHRSFQLPWKEFTPVGPGRGGARRTTNSGGRRWPPPPSFLPAPGRQVPPPTGICRVQLDPHLYCLTWLPVPLLACSPGPEKAGGTPGQQALLLLPGAGSSQVFCRVNTFFRNPIVPQVQFPRFLPGLKCFRPPSLVRKAFSASSLYRDPDFPLGISPRPVFLPYKKQTPHFSHSTLEGEPPFLCSWSGVSWALLNEDSPVLCVTYQILIPFPPRTMFFRVDSAPVSEELVQVVAWLKHFPLWSAYPLFLTFFLFRPYVSTRIAPTGASVCKSIFLAFARIRKTPTLSFFVWSVFYFFSFRVPPISKSGQENGVGVHRRLP